MPVKKKKTRKRKEADPTEKTLRLRGNLKLQYAAAVYATQAANSKLETLKAQMAHRAESDPVFAEALEMLSRESALQTDISKSISHLHTVAKKICTKFDISLDEFKHYVVDTESGQITPMRPEKGKQKE